MIGITKKTKFVVEKTIEKKYTIIEKGYYGSKEHWSEYIGANVAFMWSPIMQREVSKKRISDYNLRKKLNRKKGFRNSVNSEFNRVSADMNPVVKPHG